MSNKKLPIILIVCGFGVALASLALLLFGNLSDSTKVVVSIIQSIATGVGSIGIGTQIVWSHTRK